MQLTNPKIISILRPCIGILIARAIVYYYNIPESSWIYISLFVVTVEQTTIGGIVRRSYLRAFATISSALYSIVIIYLFNNNPLMNTIAIFFGILVYDALYLGTEDNYIGVLGAITLAVCLLNYNNITLAFMRPFNVVIGIAIGLFLGYFFFPQRATLLLVEKLHTIIEEMKNSIQELQHATTWSPKDYDNFSSSDNLVITTFSKCNALIAEARHELPKGSQFPVVIAQILTHIRKIIRYHSSAVYYIFSINNNDADDIKFALNALNHLFTLLKDEFVSKFAVFDKEGTILKLQQLQGTIKQNGSRNHVLIAITLLISEESILLVERFVQLHQLMIKPQKMKAGLFHRF